MRDMLAHKNCSLQKPRGKSFRPIYRRSLEISFSSAQARNYLQFMTWGWLLLSQTHFRLVDDTAQDLHTPCSNVLMCSGPDYIFRPRTGYDSGFVQPFLLIINKPIPCRRTFFMQFWDPLYVCICPVTYIHDRWFVQAHIGPFRDMALDGLGSKFSQRGLAQTMWVGSEITFLLSPICHIIRSETKYECRGSSWAWPDGSRLVWTKTVP